MVGCMKSADAPCRTGSDYERTLNEQLPATDEELVKLEKQHGVTFHSHIGKFLHAQQVTQFVTGFCVTRLAQFAVTPNPAAFEGIKRTA